MAKFERVNLELKEKNGEEYLLFMGKNIAPEFLLDELRKEIDEKDISRGLIKRDANYTKYIFNSTTYDVETGKPKKERITVRVSNNQKANSLVARDIESLCKTSIMIKKLNINRLIAGLSLTTMILVTTGPAFLRWFEKRLKNDYEGYLASSTFEPPINDPNYDNIVWQQSLHNQDLIRRGDEDYDSLTDFEKEEYDMLKAELENNENKSSKTR